MAVLDHPRTTDDLDWDLLDDAHPSPTTVHGSTTSPSRPRRLATAALCLAAIFGPLVGLMVGRAGVAGPLANAVGDATPAAPATAALLGTDAAAGDPTNPTPATGVGTGVPIAGLELRLTSQDGRWQAWAEPLGPGATIYAPGGRNETTIVVRDSLTGTTEAMTFPRNLEPEAFSSDGRTLYTIDHRPAHAPEIYRVTAIDLRTDLIREVIGPNKAALVEEMRGEGRQQVWAPDDGQLYTLYVRQPHLHAAPGAAHADYSDVGEPTSAFIHVLDVDNEWALCLELPAGFGLGPSGSTDIMVRDAGSTITVVDHTLGERVDVERRVVRDGAMTTFEIGPRRAA